jgi:hypothetical protein
LSSTSAVIVESEAEMLRELSRIASEPRLLNALKK